MRPWLQRSSLPCWSLGCSLNGDSENSIILYHRKGLEELRSFPKSPAKEGVMGPRRGYIDAILRSKTTGHQFLVRSKLIIQGLFWFYFTSKSEASCCFFSGVRFTELSQHGGTWILGYTVGLIWRLCVFFSTMISDILF